jgi:hypothetical protein
MVQAKEGHKALMMGNVTWTPTLEKQLARK